MEILVLLFCIKTFFFKGSFGRPSILEHWKGLPTELGNGS